jgi:hypothetical protein
VSGFFNEVADRDWTAIFEDDLGMAEDVTLISSAGGRHILRALFEAPSVDVTPGTAHAPVLSAAPTLHLAASHVMAAIGRPLGSRDAFLIRGKGYLAHRPADDGYGIVTCTLLEQNYGDD